MSRYIDADKFKKDLKDRYYVLEKEFGCYDSYVEAIDECIDKIENAPTADVQEVKYGKYIGEQQYGDCVMQHCSQCGYLVYVDDYCGHCGAKMDGKEKDIEQEYQEAIEAAKSRNEEITDEVGFKQFIENEIEGVKK